MKATAKNVHPRTLAVRGNGYYTHTRSTHRQTILLESLWARYRALGLAGRPGFLNKISGIEALKLLNVVDSRPQTLSAETVSLLRDHAQWVHDIRAGQRLYDRRAATRRASLEYQVVFYSPKATGR